MNTLPVPNDTSLTVPLGIQKKALFVVIEGVLVEKSSLPFPNDKYYKFDERYVKAIKDYMVAFDINCIILVDNYPGVQLGIQDDYVINERVDSIKVDLARKLNYDIRRMASYVSFSNNKLHSNNFPKSGIFYSCALKFDLDMSKSTLICETHNQQLAAERAGLTIYTLAWGIEESAKQG